MDLCIIEGDGIGREVIPAAVQILRCVVPELEVKTARAGWDTFQECGTSLPEETVELAQSCRAVLFGAAISPPYPVEGYFYPVVRLRQILETYASLRPTYYLPVATARKGVDLLVVRENTEGLYTGDECVEAGGDRGTARRVVTRAATERVAHTACQIAINSGRNRVTIVHKANVLPQSDGLFRRVAFEVAEQYPDLEVDALLVDTAAYWMVREPERFDVILTSNLYGDILSDMAAAWGGGLGLASSVNIGEDVCIGEPVHSAALDIAGKGVANPGAAILSAALMLRYHWKMPEAALQIEEAVRSTLAAGKHTADIQPKSAISTDEFTVQVCAYLERDDKGTNDAAVV